MAVPFFACSSWICIMKKKRKARTRIELLAIVLILVAVTLVVITIPRMSRNSASAKTMACNTNIAMMNTRIEAYYSEYDVWPTDLEIITSDANYFPKGTLSCPAGGRYSIHDKTHRVSCSAHGH